MTAAEMNDWIALATGLGALAVAVMAWRRKAWRRVSDWGRSVKARKQATEAMVNSWPTVLEFMAGANSRDDKASAREVRMTAEFKGLREHLERQDRKLDTIVARQWGAMKLDPQARFICDSEGRNSEVNTAYAQMLRVGEASLKGYGYKNYIDPAQLQKYIATVLQAFREHRRFEGTVVMIRGDATRFLAHVRLEPYPEDPSQGEATHWFGAVTMVEEVVG